MINLLISLPLLTLGSLAGGQTANKINDHQWSQRGVFVFYRGPIIDFQKDILNFSLGTSHVRDCSNESYYCLKSEYINIVLPYECVDLEIGDSLTSEEITMHVVGAGEYPLAPHENQVGEDYYYITEEGNPYMVYEYSNSSGVKNIYLDVLKKVNMEEKARNSSLKEFVGKNIRYRAPLVTFDPFGKCKKASDLH